jgi:hypothetical protein
MKTINIKKKTSKIQKATKRLLTRVYKRIKSIDLLDGQRRGEIIFRRVFFLMAMAMFIYLFLLIVVGKKEDIDVEEVNAQGIVIEDKVEWVDGNRVTTKSDGSVEIVPAEVFKSKEELEKLNEDHQKAEKIEIFFRVNRGNAPLANYAEKFVEVANKYGLDYRLLPAIATVESGGGKNNFRSYNAWGWGNRSFRSFEEGIEVVAKGLKTGYIDKGRDTVEEIAPIYCPPNYKNWARSVNQFMNEIENIESK